MEQISDLEVIQMIRNGDRKAYSLLVRRHQKSLLRLSVRFVKDMDAAEDIVQESFIKAFERLASFEARSSFRSWLFQIAINTAKNKLRSRRDEINDVENLPLAVAAIAETGLLHSAVADLIQKHVDQLPFKQKTALTLRIYEDLSFKEIAEIMDCPYDTAKANYRHALMRLREELQTQEDLKQWTEEVGGFFMEFEKRTAEVES
ncbi:MAG: RNA polymerase sigma factor [Pseudobdellovibrionaceae bacterium]